MRMPAWFYIKQAIADLLNALEHCLRDESDLCKSTIKHAIMKLETAIRELQMNSS